MKKLSRNAFVILKALANKPVPFERAVKFNQVSFYALIRSDMISLDLQSETFQLTPDGLSVYGAYANGNVNDLLVKHLTQMRHDRVAVNLIASAPRPKTKRKAA